MSRKSFSFIFFVVLGALTLAACGQAPAEPMQVPAGAQAGDLTAMEACDFQPGKTVFAAECGTLTVPENWDDPQARLIALPVVRIPATGANPAWPVVWLQGGPGSPNLSFAPPAWLLEDHDVIEVGYRGAEGSVVLDCPAVNELVLDQMGKGLFTDETRAQLTGLVKECGASFEEAGVDLSGYTVPGVIRDTEAARLALGYDQVDLYAVSYGTRVAQLYAYDYPESLHRVAMVGLNPPGHFMYDRDALDAMLGQIGELCAADAACSQRTGDLAGDIYAVNHTMPDHWLWFNIDEGSVRLASHMMLFANPNMPMVLDMYMSAADGDASGLAMLSLMGKYVFPPFQLGDLFNKGGTLDGDLYQGIQSINLGDSVLGSPLSEFIWPMASQWPYQVVADAYLHIHESDVDMLVVNGTLDFSTPPTALDEVRPYWHNTQFVLLDGFSHVADVESLQPAAFQRLLTSYYDTGAADDSLFVPQPVSFKPGLSLALMIKLLVALIVLLPLLVISVVVFIVRRQRAK